MVVPSKPENNNASNPIARRSTGPGVLSILYSVTKKVGTVAIVYLLGYYNISVAWLIGPVILSVVREEWKRSSDARRTLAKAAAMSNEKEVIMARIDELPAWVCGVCLVLLDTLLGTKSIHFCCTFSLSLSHACSLVLCSFSAFVWGKILLLKLQVYFPDVERAEWLNRVSPVSRM